MKLAIVQARMTSSRLPGKVAKHILGKPMLVYQLERIRKSALIDKLVVATSIDSSDDIICDICNEYNTEYYRGSLNDVLDRFYHAAKDYNPRHVIRFTADCPLIDPEIIDRVIDFHLAGNFDYSSNVNPPTFPDGMSVEVINWSALEIARKDSFLPSHREHVTLYLYQNPQKFKLGNVLNDIDLSQIRLTVDYEEDFYLISKIYEFLYPAKPNFLMADILDFLNNHKELKLINAKYKRYEGLKKSLEMDVKFLDRS